MKPGNLCLLLEKISSLIPFIFFAPPIFFLLASFYCVHDTIDSTNASLAVVCTVVPCVKVIIQRANTLHTDTFLEHHMAVPRSTLHFSALSGLSSSSTCYKLNHITLAEPITCCTNLTYYFIS